MYKLVIKDIRQKTTIEDRQPYFVHVTRKSIKLAQTSSLRSLAYYNDSTHTIYLFFTNESKEWQLTPDYTPLYKVDDHLDLSRFNVVRYIVTGDVEATIENYTSTYVNVSTTTDARVRLYVSGEQTSVRASVRSRSYLSICGSASTLEIRSLHADSYLDLTTFDGGHLYRNEVDVVQQSILCSAQFHNDEETSRQRYVREHIKIPSADTERREGKGEVCLLCCDDQVTVQCKPCDHSCMCLSCTRILHGQPHSLFTCPLCRKEIQEVQLL